MVIGSDAVMVVSKLVVVRVVAVWILLVCPTLFEDLVLMLDMLEVYSLLKLLDDICPIVAVL